MSRATVLLALLVAGSAHAAGGDTDPKAMLQLSTGMRPMGLPLVSTVSGTGLRGGLVFGPVTPFVGGSATWGNLELDYGGGGNDGPLMVGTGWTLQAGAQVRVTEVEYAEAHVVAGTLLSRYAGRDVWDRDSGRASGGSAFAGPGAFAGFGADAFLTDRVSIALEGGLAWVRGAGLAIKNYEDGGSTTRDEYNKASLLHGYSSLGLTLWLGGGE